MGDGFPKACSQQNELHEMKLTDFLCCQNKTKPKKFQVQKAAAPRRMLPEKKERKKGKKERKKEEATNKITTAGVKNTLINL